ncbi:hypothetical protein [Nonomuraea fuscirosea]|uniref:hypothetical protein n=1 Tax=Nonomuraea fuscirosea TaxID=1291556 RepID=UPI0034212673
MITLDGPGIVVHRLVQDIARTPDPADPHRQAGDLDAARRPLADVSPAMPRAGRRLTRRPVLCEATCDGRPLKRHPDKARPATE